MKTVASWLTGSRMGYIGVNERGVESKLVEIPKSLKGLRGNERWALEYFKQNGAKFYTTTCYQGVPGKGFSKQYCYTVYKAYV